GVALDDPLRHVTAHAVAAGLDRTCMRGVRRVLCAGVAPGADAVVGSGVLGGVAVRIVAGDAGEALAALRVGALAEAAAAEKADRGEASGDRVGDPQVARQAGAVAAAAGSYQRPRGKRPVGGAAGNLDGVRGMPGARGFHVTQA